MIHQDNPVVELLKKANKANRKYTYTLSTLVISTLTALAVGVVIGIYV